MNPPAVACMRTGLPECPLDVQAGCQLKISALEQAVARLEQSNRNMTQSNRELLDAVRAATAESKRRSAALDDLAKKLLVRDNGIKLLNDEKP